MKANFNLVCFKQVDSCFLYVVYGTSFYRWTRMNQCELSIPYRISENNFKLYVSI